MDNKHIPLKSKIKVILKFAKPHKWMFAILFLCIIVTTFSGALYPYIFGRLVDEVFYGQNMSLFFEIIFIYGIIYIFNQLMHFALNMSWAQLMTKFLFDIKEALFVKGLSLKGERLASGYSGDMINRINKNVNQFMDFIHVNVFYFIGGVINLVVSIAFLWYLNIYIAIFTILLTPIIVYIARAFSKKAKKYAKDTAKQEGFLSAWLFEIIRGMQDIRLLGAAKHVVSDFTGKTIKIIKLKIKSDKVEVTSERVNSGISLIARLSLYAISAAFVINGQLTVGGFTACIAYFGTCISIFKSLNEKVVAIAVNMAAIERVCEVLSEESEEYNNTTQNIDIEMGNIAFDNVRFSYNNRTQVLNEISLYIKAGEKISLVGRSGAGKSTVANLLYKLYTIQSGDIYIDNVNINDFNLHNLRNQIGIVHQDSIIFDETVRFNIAYSNDTANDEKIWSALKMSYLYDFIKSLPNGLDTQLGYKGIQLSGGQKQRLSITRIFLKNPKILIFDEATSALDSEAETIIKQSWDALCKNRTIIIIAHRLSTILNSDKIAVLDEGNIKGYDTHDNLLKDCPVYIDLFKEQYCMQEANENV